MDLLFYIAWDVMILMRANPLQGTCVTQREQRTLHSTDAHSLIASLHEPDNTKKFNINTT
jgi:hypothetical protein